MNLSRGDDDKAAGRVGVVASAVEQLSGAILDEAQVVLLVPVSRIRPGHADTPLELDPRQVSRPRNRDRLSHSAAGPLSSGFVSDQWEWIVRQRPLVRWYTSVEFHRGPAFSEPSGCRR